MNMPLYHPASSSTNTLYLESKDADQFLLEVDQYLNQYPATEHIDICLHDLNGHLRGKRIDIKSLKNLSKGCYFPLSICACFSDWFAQGRKEPKMGKQRWSGSPIYFPSPLSSITLPSKLMA